jgi:hypothetical protein
MDNTVILLHHQTSILEFNVDVQGIDTENMNARLIIESNDMELGFKGVSKGANTWEVKIPPLTMLECTTYQFYIDVVVDGYYFKPLQGKIGIVNSIDMNATTPINTSTAPSPVSPPDLPKTPIITVSTPIIEPATPPVTVISPPINDVIKSTVKPEVPEIPTLTDRPVVPDTIPKTDEPTFTTLKTMLTPPDDLTKPSTAEVDTIVTQILTGPTGMKIEIPPKEPESEEKDNTKQPSVPIIKPKKRSKKVKEVKEDKKEKELVKSKDAVINEILKVDHVKSKPKVSPFKKGKVIVH